MRYCRYLFVLVAMSAFVHAGYEFTALRTDTVGGTTYDWQQSGPALMTIVNDTNYGIHISWMRSTVPGQNYPDRNKGYNFYDKAAGVWNWFDPSNFMNSGVNAYTAKNGYGSMDVDPTTGNAYISTHYVTAPSIVRDAAPGAGIFEECGGPPNCTGYVWPVTGITSDGVVHNALIDASTRSQVWYSRITPWCTWSVPGYISTSPSIDPSYPSHLLAVSRRSNTVIITWTDPLADTVKLFIRKSADGGLTWEDPYALDPPPAFSPGSDTWPSFDLSGAYVAFDRDDNWHLVTTVVPLVDGNLYVLPAEIWHYSAANTPMWSRIRRATCDTLHLAGSVGYNAVYACRPSIGFDFHSDKSFVVWEEFDSMNVEPTTGRLRADIWGAFSTDNGVTWNSGANGRLTSPDNTSKRFPVIATVADGDTLHVNYEQDIVAGFPIRSEGEITNNPIVYARATWVFRPGVAEGPLVSRATPSLRVFPNPFSERVGFACHGFAPRILTICDAAGRQVHAAGASLGEALSWDGRGAAGEKLAAGIYFYRLTTDYREFSGKLLKTD